MKTLKWELMKRVDQLRWLVLTYVALLVVMCLLPSNVRFHSSFGGRIHSLLVLFSLMAIFGSLFIIVVYPTLYVIIEMRERYCLLERVNSRPFIITALVRTVLNVLSVLLGSGLILLGSEIMKKFQTETTWNLVEINLTIPYENLLFMTAIFLPTVVLFSYVTVSSIPALRKFSLSVAIVMSIIIVGAVMYTLKADIYAHMPVVIKCTIVALTFIMFGLSCWLYDNKYEITNV